MEHPSFLFLLFLLILAFSIQTQARESKFFSKTMRFEAFPTSIAEEPLPSELALPPQSHNGYGLYGHDIPDQFPSKTTSTTNHNADSNNNNAYNEPSTIPSSFTTTEFSAQNYENNERNYYGNNDSPPTSFTNPEFPSSTDQTYEKKVSNYPYYDNQNRYGMSDTRFMENGRYFYDVNKKNYDESMNSGINSERSYGSYANKRNNGYDQYKNDLEAYLNSKENQESQIDYIDP